MKRYKVSRTANFGFSLMEMLVVVSILVLLAGLTIGVVAFINEKQALDQAKVQINLLETGLEQYNADNGEPPANANARGIGGTTKIFETMFPNNANEKPYLVELDPNNDPLGWIEGSGNSIKILDPWGAEYRYRTNRTNGSAIICVNPDFDLWSCGPDGETEPGTGGNYDPMDPKNLDDVRTW